MSNSKVSNGNFTLCWDCILATDFQKCEWAGEGKPVPGWDAVPTTIKMPKGYEPTHSYHVTRCPKFKRCSVAGGQERCLLVSDDSISLDNNDVKNIAEAIVESAVDDWKALDYGTRAVVYRHRMEIEREEVLEFFFSHRFGVLLGTFSQRLPSQIRSYLGITDDMNPSLKKGEKI